MKKVMLAAFAAILSCGMAIAAEAPASTSISISAPDSPQVCQFSLTKYSGTITPSGYTEYFKVGLSCPQENDVRATVMVYIDGARVASQVVTIKTGNDYSESVQISVGREYNGQKYKMLVQ